MKEKGKYVGWEHKGQPFNKKQFRNSLLKKNTNTSYKTYLKTYSEADNPPQRVARVAKRTTTTNKKVTKKRIITRRKRGLFDAPGWL